MSDDDKTNDAAGHSLGGTQMVDAAPDAPALGGTMLLQDEAPRVAVDGTLLIDASPAADLPPAHESTVIVNRSSKPPPLPPTFDTSDLDGEGTSLPPNLGPTPAPPQARDLTFDRAELDGDETTDEPASPIAAPVKPAPVAPQATVSPPAAVPPPAASGEATPAARTAPEPFPPQPAQTSAATTAGVAKPAPAAAAAGTKPSGPTGSSAGGTTAPPKATAPRKKFPLWAQLLALVVVAGGVGHLVARMQQDKTPATAQPTAKAPPKPTPPPKAAPATPTSPPSTEPTEPVPSAAPEPPPVVAAADLPACVTKELGVTLPAEDVKLVCEEADANRAQRNMSALLATHDVDRDARGAWNSFGWYRMAKLQIVRTRCCGNAPPIAISKALSACGLDESLAAMHQADRNKTSLTEPVQAYRKAVDCLFKANTMRMFGIIARPGEYQENAFVASVTR